MTGMAALQRRAGKARDWLHDACFPLWAAQGIEQGGFREALDLQHVGIVSGQARVRVQARQTYMFSAAKRLNWSPQQADELVRLGVQTLCEACPNEVGLFTRKIDLQARAPLSQEGDLYDTAFALFAMASAQRIGVDTAAPMAKAFSALDAQLTDVSGGYAEAAPRPFHRLQNPHMHLFEACLEAFAATGTRAYLDRASALRQLCLTRFIDPRTRTLGETFERSDWRISEGETGQIVEPGHQFEWVWLLEQYARLAGAQLPEQAKWLYAFGCQTLDEAGAAVQAVRRDGTVHDGSRRTWPQTEALKAHLTMMRAGDETAAARAVQSFDLLVETYLTPEGGWKDHFAADGEMLAKDMPASTGYHILVAFLDLIDTVGA